MTITQPTNVHPLFRSLPGMADIDKQEAKLRKQLAFRDDAWRKDNERFEREEARYLERVKEADEALKDRPKRHHRGAPDFLERRGEIESFQRRFDALAQERRARIAEHADTITAQLLDAEADELSKARDAVTVLDEVSAEVESLRDLLRRVNLADNRPARTGGGRIEAIDLISIVRSGNTVLQPGRGSVEVTDLGGGIRFTKRTAPTNDENSDPELLHHSGRDYPTGNVIKREEKPVFRRRV